MKKRKELFLAMLIIMTAILGSVLCVRHYGMGIESYYEEQLEDVPSIMQEICWLEDGTIVEQSFASSASYIGGVNLILLGTEEESEGILCIQLCDDEGNVLSQNDEKLCEIEAGQFYFVQFQDMIDVSDYEKLMIRIYVEENDVVPGLITVSTSMDVQDSISCSVNGEMKPYNLAITYLYGKWQYVGYEGKSNGAKEVMAASVILIVLVSFGVIYLVYNIKNIDVKTIIRACKNPENFKQILYILWFFVIFLAAAAFSKLRNNKNVPIGVYLYIILVAGITGYYFRQRVRVGYKNRPNIFNKILQDKGLLIVILLSTLIRIPLFVNIQLWDGSIYYGTLQRICKNFEYEFAYIWETFRLCGHYSIVYTLFVSIGEFLLPDNMTGVLLVLLVLTDAALICIYKMLKEYWLNLSQKEAFIGTMLVSVCPLFLGLFSNVSLDSLLVIFAVFLFYAEYKKQMIMKVVWLISIMLTKETGLVIAGGYLLAHIFAHLRNTIKYKKKDKVKYFFSDFHVICAIGGVILVCFYTIKQNGLFTWFGMNQKTDSNLFTEYLKMLSESVPFVLQKIKILFVMNFEWIPTLMIIVCIIYCILNHREMPSFSGQISFLGTLGIFILLNCYLLRYVLGRYHMYSAVMIWILAYIILFKTFGNLLKSKIGFGVSVIVIVLLVIQNFYFVDPLTNLAFERYDTGKGKMISTEFHGGNFSETFVNNFRYTYLYGLIDIMLEESEFDGETQIIIPLVKDTLVMHEFTGYDVNKKRRVFNANPDGENVVEIKRASLEEILEGNMEDIPERGVMYFLPYMNCDEEENVKKAEQFYEVGERREISNWGGSLVYYVLEPK